MVNGRRGPHPLAAMHTSYRLLNAEPADAGSSDVVTEAPCRTSVKPPEFNSIKFNETMNLRVLAVQQR
jgi:hypothetical protein